MARTGAVAPRGAPTTQFRSCLLVSSTEDRTLHFTRALHRAGFAVLERLPLPSSVEMAANGDFDVVAWVVNPNRSEFIVQLGEIAASGTPMIALLADATPEAVSACLHAGADACLQLDADDRVVIAQVHAVLRRHGPPAGATAEDLGLIQVGDLAIDVDRCEVTRQGQYVPLTASEFRIVAHMATNAGRVLRPHEILNAVSEDYHYKAREAQDVFKVYVRRIRRKLEPSEAEPRYLVTVRGLGYRLDGGQPRSVPVAQTA
jgi:two-component system, OmpR family, response regulator RegX3